MYHTPPLRRFRGTRQRERAVRRRLAAEHGRPGLEAERGPGVRHGVAPGRGLHLLYPRFHGHSLELRGSLLSFRLNDTCFHITKVAIQLGQQLPAYDAQECRATIQAIHLIAAIQELARHSAHAIRMKPGLAKPARNTRTRFTFFSALAAWPFFRSTIGGRGHGSIARHPPIHDFADSRFRRFTIHDSADSRSHDSFRYRVFFLLSISYWHMYCSVFCFSF